MEEKLKLGEKFKRNVFRLWYYLSQERGDFIQNAIYIALVVVFGIGVLTKFGKAIEANFEAIISKFSATKPGA